jgi:hypothetical protein
MTVSLKNLEAQHAAEKALQEQKQLAEKNKVTQAAKAAEAASAALQTRCLQLKAGLEMMAGEARALRQGTRYELISRESSTTASEGGWSSRSCSPTPGSTSGGRSTVIIKAVGSCRVGSVCLAPSDAGAGGPDGQAGVRWVYLHQRSGPWAFARQALASVTSVTPSGRPGSGNATTASLNGSVSGMMLSSKNSSIAGSMRGGRQQADNVFSASGETRSDRPEEADLRLLAI